MSLWELTDVVQVLSQSLGTFERAAFLAEKYDQCAIGHACTGSVAKTIRIQ